MPCLRADTTHLSTLQTQTPALNVKLNPDGLLVVSGRLEHAMLKQDAREPILIAKRSKFTTLIVCSVHERQLHAGVRDTVVAIRKRF